METTERIVEAYVRHVMGCATMTNVRCEGQNEIDILAINPKTLHRYHIEVSISISSAFRKLTAKPFDQEKVKERGQQASQRRTVGFFAERKFGAPTVIERLADFGFAPGKYTKAIATWGWTEEAAAQAEAAGIELWDFRQMISLIADDVRQDRKYHTDDTLRTLSLFVKAMDDLEKDGPQTTIKSEDKAGPFWVYTNVQRNKAVVHLAECSSCNHGHGIHADSAGITSVWHGPFDEETARQTARASGKRDIRWCSICAKKLRIEPGDV